MTGQESTDTLRMSDSLRVVKLKLAIKDLDNKTSQQDYFSFFPDNFVSFKSIFGYREGKEGLELGYLYEASLQYISAYFQNLTSIGRSSISEKAINITANGVWQTDGINIFQHYLIEDMKNNGKHYFLVLDTLEDARIFSFWIFYFGGPHPESYKDDFTTLYNECAEKNPRIAILMKEAFETLLSENDRHGH